MLPKAIPVLALMLALAGNVPATTISPPVFGKNNTAAERPPLGCVDSVLLVVKPVMCHGLRTGELLVADVFGGTAPHYFSLDGDNFTTNPLFDRLWAGIYTLTVRDSTGCTLERTVEVPEAPELKVKLNANKTDLKAGEHVFLWANVQPQGNEIVEISWRPPALFQFQDTLRQRVRLVDSETIAVEVVTSAGCVARDQVSIEVAKAVVFVPNAFMPGSNQNSYFTVYAGEGVAVVRALRVYDRWNKVVFESLDFPPNDPLRGWDGRLGSKRATPGVYNWVTEVEYLNGSREIISGDVTLLRDTE